MKQLIDRLAEYVTDNKKEQIGRVLEARTRHLTVVLEDIYQSHNASAVIRTCECFGIQDVHVIENENRYQLNPKVVMGAAKWIDMYHYCIPGMDNSASCLLNLKQKGYRIIATSPDKNCPSINDLDIEGKMALVFGTEKLGVSNVIDELADERVRIPMHGFTESYNISVSAALVLYTLTQRLRNSDVAWRLTKDEKQALQLEWYKKCVKNPELLIKKFESE